MADRVADLDWRSVAVALGAFVALVALTGLVRSIPRTITALLIALVLALALNPLVNALEQRAGLRRPVAIASIVAGVAAVVLALGVLLVPAAVREGRNLGRDIPTVVADLERLPLVGGQLADNDVPARVEAWLNELPSRLKGDTTPIERVGRSVADGLLAATITLLFAITLLLDGDRLLRAARRLIPDRFGERAERVGRLAYDVVGRYVAGSLLVAALAGIVTLAVGIGFGVPLAPLAAAWVAVWNLVPQIGGAAGGIPFVALAFTQGVGTGAAVGIFFLVYLQFENHILQPLLVGKAVKLSPPATMTAALIGVSAAGVVGALVAVPLVGASKAVYLEIRSGRLASEEPTGRAAPANS